MLTRAVLHKRLPCSDSCPTKSSRHSATWPLSATLASYCCEQVSCNCPTCLFNSADHHRGITGNCCADCQEQCVSDLLWLGHVCSAFDWQASRQTDRQGPTSKQRKQKGKARQSKKRQRAKAAHKGIENKPMHSKAEQTRAGQSKAYQMLSSPVLFQAIC